MTASIGIALFDSDPRATGTTVLAEADMAMYAAKDAGRDGIHVFDHESDTAREEE
jgi:GGDEF domain-containing protein